MVKPTVGILYSEPRHCSEESKLMALYLGALMFHGGYSSVRLLCVSVEDCGKKGKSGEPKKSGMETEVTIAIDGEKSRTFKEQADLCMNCSVATLADCHVIILCVNPTDTERAVSLLKTTLPTPSKAHDQPIGIFTFQHGSSNFEKIETVLKGRSNLLLIDGAVGFHVVRGRADGVIRPLVPGQLVLERLSKEKSVHGVNFVNLLSTTQLPMLFRKKLTPFTWGTMVHDCYFAINALTGDSLDSFLRSRKNRLIYAQMIRECLQAFQVAANYDKWAPSNAASCPIELPMLELLLCLPDALFVFVKYFAFPCAPGAGSPAQDVLQARRSTNSLWTMQQLVGVGNKYNITMPACVHVLKLLEVAVRENNGVPSTPPSAICAGIDAPFKSTAQLARSTSLLGIGALGLFLVLLLGSALLPRESGLV